MKRMGGRTVLGMAVGAAGMVWAGLAQAGPPAPGLAPVATRVAPAAVEAVTWVCGPYRCDWRPGARVVVPGYAVGWGAPRYPWCYWTKVRGPYGAWRWVQVCK